ncbi:methyl-accepting chemotaxis protein [Blastochloris viridis]|uniref:Methyl-accepting chemotaxis protein n=1 Tax=Blastochloris viridis TaxID=1079 RepID=A0A0H5BD35_BLAVI|nr:HAMP domain-containing methyl-accepting chemotaxis protein [Blastochloris viridis]ALK09969.1 Methyl-accepting chemotaxis protein McpS [Blastochloris viridis]BAS00116.1 methyl-accepting chemotaxis protein [Blastochloris viridis]CUU42632.1 Methyl-accepting chemotaxis protein 2 [Blastochloris viridis]
MKLNLKIGQKLSVSAGLGIVLVLALVALSRFATDSIHHAAVSLTGNTAMFEAALRAQMDWRDARIAFRDARLATTPEALDRAIKAGDDTGKALTGRFEVIAAQTSNDADKAKATKARDLAASYALYLNEALQAEGRRQQARQRLVELGANWDETIAKLRAAVQERSADLLVLVERLDGHASEARAAIWAFHASEDVQQKAKVARVVADSSPILKELGDSVSNASALITKLAGLVTRFPTAMSSAMDAVAARNSANGSAEPVRAELGKLLAEFTDTANRQNVALTDGVETAIAKAETSGLTLGALAVAAMLGAAVFGFVGVGNPVRRIAAVLERLANGDKTVDIPFTRRGDEVGDTARAAQVFKDNLVRMDLLDAERLEAEARAEAEKKQAMHELATSFESAVGGIIGAVSSAATQLQGAAQTMSAAADETNHQSSAVAAASEEATSNVQTVASAAEELSASVSEIGRRVNESARIAAEAAKDADATAGKVARLSQAAQKIGDIVGLISTIAGQTNLLALNATIEAARAGDAGRGFAVVASEVKSLADQTAKATAEISAQIEEIQSSTAESATAIGQITEIIRQMNEIATTIASAVEQQGAATTEIARNVQQASSGTAEVSSNIVGVTRAASESSAASTQVLASAGELAMQSGVLKAEVTKFLAMVRAA